jgi:hypothetical protein
MPAPALFSTRGKMRSKNPQGGPSIQTPLPGMGNYTVEFSVSNRQIVPPGVALGNITPVATISWALAGNQFTRKVSVFDGASITGCAEHVTVSLSDETDPLDLTDVTDYIASISVAAGVRGPTGLPPTYQTYINHFGVVAYGSVIVPSANVFAIPVPQDAGIASVMITSAINGGPTPGSPPDLVTQQDWQAVPAELKVYQPNMYGFVPVSASCKNILLAANDTANSTTFSITWGIDG